MEIYQNCNVFNDGAFASFTDKGTKEITTLFVEHGKPLLFGEGNSKGIRLDDTTPVIVDLNTENISVDELWIHNKYDRYKAQLMIRFFDDPMNGGTLPRPFGIFYQEDRSCYEEDHSEQIRLSIENKGKGDLDKLLRGNNSWEIR